MILGLLPMLGCRYTRYEYTIDVNNADRQSNGEGTLAGPPAHVRVEWYGGTHKINGHTITIPDFEGAATMDVTEQVGFDREFGGTTRHGLQITVTKEGYKTWEASYGVSGFIDSEDILRRIDMVRLEPTSSQKPSELILSVPQSTEKACLYAP
jgi:hypothetical protein